MTHPVVFNEDNANNPKIVNALAKIQCAWKMYQVFRKFKIRKKKLITRKFVIEELIKTEIDYKAHLELVIREVLEYSLNNNILTLTESEIIFSNIREIEELSGNLVNELTKISENFDNKNTEVAKIFQNHFKTFEIYFIYCRNYKEMQVVMEKFIKKNHSFSQFLETIEHTSRLNKTDLFSFLIKPIQRLPKYVLLFKDLLKNTEPSHPDFYNIEIALKKFQELNTKNNENMEEYLIKQTKIIELQETYGNPNSLLILNGTREFIQEEVLNMVINGMPNPVICYFLTDAIIVAKRNNDQCILVNLFELDNNSFIKDLTKQTYYKYIFNLYGKQGGITLSTESKEGKQNVIKLLENQIFPNLRLKHEMNLMCRKKLQKIKTYDILLDKLFNQIRVSVLGTIQRGFKDLYHVYVIEICLEDFTQKIFLRYSECLKLDEMIKKDYPDIFFTHLTKDYWFNSNKIKTIEARKIMIENFLQSIITNQSLIKDDKKFFKFIGFPKSFDLFAKDKNFNCEFIDPYDCINKFIENSEPFSTASILRQCIKIGKNRISDKEEGMTPLTSSSIKSIVQIKLMDDRVIEISYTNKTKIYELFITLVQKINLKSFLDFKLFMVNLNQEEKPLDDDEFVYKILQQDMNEKDEHESKSFFKMFKSKSSVNSFCLILKKYYFLPPEIEEKDLRKDKVKLSLVTYQIFNEAENFKFKLSIEDFSLLISLKIYLKDPDANDLDKSNFLKLLKKMIPSTIFPRQKENQWETNIRSLLTKIENEVKGILEKSLSKSSGGSMSLDFGLIIFLTTINFIRQNNMYGARFFWANVISKNLEKNIKIPEFVWLAIKHDRIALVSPEDKEKKFSLKLEKIIKIHVYPMSLHLDFNGGKLKLGTNSSFEIYELINDYIKIKKVLPGARRDSYQKNKKRNSFD